MGKTAFKVACIAICFPLVSACNRGQRAPATDGSDALGSDFCPVALLPDAVAAVRQTAEEKHIKGKYWIRVEIHLPGGPETLRHTLDIELDRPRKQDREFENAGLHVVVLRNQVEMLRGCTVDYGEKNGRKGFKIKNPRFEGEEASKWLMELERQRGS